MTPGQDGGRRGRTRPPAAGAPPLPGRRARRRAQARAALLDAALALFAERGLEATRVEDITERADVAKGAFYSHFETKDALVAALVRLGVELLDAQYLARVPAVGPPARRLAGLVRSHHAFFADHPGHALLFHQARGIVLLRSAGTAPLREAFAEYLDRLARRLPRPSRGRRTEPAELAAVVGGAIVGHRSLSLAAGRAQRPSLLARCLTEGVAALLG